MIFREEATSALAGFHNLVSLVFVEGGKPENSEKKTSDQGERQRQIQHGTRPESSPGHIFVGGERSHRCGIPVTRIQNMKNKDNLSSKLSKFSRKSNKMAINLR